MSDFEETTDDGKLISEKTWNRMKASLQLEGLREGAASGRDLAFQKGFDQGFTEGFKAAHCLGHLKSLLTTLKYGNFGIPANPDIEEISLQNPQRGLCQMCPNTSGTVKKEEMADKLEQFVTLPIEDIISKQRSIVKEVVDTAKPKLLGHVQSLNIEVDFLDLYN